MDYFVLVESRKTFMGHPKPLYFDKEKYKEYGEKIIHVVHDFEVNATGNGDGGY